MEQLQRIRELNARRQKAASRSIPRAGAEVSRIPGPGGGRRAARGGPFGGSPSRLRVPEAGGWEALREDLEDHTDRGKEDPGKAQQWHWRDLTLKCLAQRPLSHLEWTAVKCKLTLVSQARGPACRSTRRPTDEPQ